jgi:hypothetical protein
MISPETIKEFQEAAEKDFGAILDIKDAEEILRDLVGFVDTLAQIDFKEKVEDPALAS